MSAAPLAGRKAVITGGSRGIGRAIACRLLAEGAEVIVTGRDAEAVARTAEELRCPGKVADATDAAAMRDYIQSA